MRTQCKNGKLPNLISSSLTHTQIWRVFINYKIQKYLNMINKQYFVVQKQ